jgi:hypothetical protein
MMKFSALKSADLQHWVANLVCGRMSNMRALPFCAAETLQIFVPELAQERGDAMVECPMCLPCKGTASYLVHCACGDEAKLNTRTSSMEIFWRQNVLRDRLSRSDPASRRADA